MLRIVYIALLGIALSICFLSESQAGTRLKVAAVHIPLMSESPTQGVFIDLLKDISQRSGLEFDVKVYPGKRAHYLFQQGEVDLLLPFPKGNRKKTGLLTDPIYSKRDFIFVKKGTPIPKTLEEAAGMRLGITEHYKYDARLYAQADLKLETTHSDLLNVRKLHSGRIDGFVAEEYSALSALKKSGFEDILYDQDHPVFTYDAVMLVQTTTQGLKTLEQINAALAELKKSQGHPALTQN